MYGIATKPKIPRRLQPEPKTKPLTLKRKPGGRYIDWEHPSTVDAVKTCILTRELTYSETAKVLGASYSSIKKAAYKFGIRSKHVNQPGRQKFKFTSEERKAIIALRAIKVPLHEVADILNIGRTTFTDLVRKDRNLCFLIDLERKKTLKETLKKLDLD